MENDTCEICGRKVAVKMNEANRLCAECAQDAVALSLESRIPVCVAVDNDKEIWVFPNHDNLN